MFNFTHVLNASTGEKYYIDKAILENDEGYDTTPSGVNLFDNRPTTRKHGFACGHRCFADCRKWRRLGSCFQKF